jgi:hypothetical protein
MASQMAQDAVARNTAMVNGIKAICKAVAEIDVDAAIHMAFEYGLVCGGAKLEAAALAGQKAAAVPTETTPA